MSWDDSDDDFLDGLSWGLFFSNIPFWFYILILVLACLILYYS